MSRHFLAVVSLALTGTLMGTPAEAVQRAFVASYGSDANVATNCGLANPCRGFAAAMTVVDSNGEVLALDSAGYGSVTPVKSVSLIGAPGVYAGISVSSGTGVLINTAGISVTLRGLSINNLAGSSSGVVMINGAKLSIENCVISNFAAGVTVNTPAAVRISDSVIRDGDTGMFIQGGATAAISGSRIVGNATYGIQVATYAPGTTTASITDTVITHNASVGLFVIAVNAGAVSRVSAIRSTISHGADGADVDFSGGATAILTLGSSMVTDNLSGLFVRPGATLESLGNNIVRQNGTDTTGTITTVPGV